MRKGSKRLLKAGILAGIAYGGWRWWQAQAAAQHRAISWEEAPFPFPPVPRPSVPETSAPEPPAPPEAAKPKPTPKPKPKASSKQKAKPALSVEPGDDGACPATHPVKAKLASGIYHEPGGGNYERTKADRCYLDAAAAEADGLPRCKALTRAIRRATIPRVRRLRAACAPRHARARAR